MINLSMKMEAKVIANFAVVHFSAANTFAKKVEEIEAENEGKPLSNFYSEIRMYCSSCIISSAAAIEALINELYLTPGPLQNSIENFDEYFWGSDESKNGLERKPALIKYKKAMSLLERPPLKRDEETYINAESLIGFRDFLIHFKPLWDESKRDETLEGRLAGKFPLSPFIDTGAEFLAVRCMSAGAARWSVETARNFILDFGERANVEYFEKKFNAFK